jgi:hypothetical protein
MDCFNAIRDVLAGNDDGDVVDNDKNQCEQHDVDAQVVNDNMQHASNAAMDDPLPCDVVDNNNNQDEQKVAEAQVCDDNMQQTSNAAMEDPLPAELCADNEKGTERTDSPIQSPWPNVSLASLILPSCS